MATVTQITLLDSINGSTEGVETVTFFHPMTGQKMTIELDEKNRNSFGTHLERMNKYFHAAEVVEEVVPAKPKAAAKNGENAKIRAWAQENGFAIGDRGRISAEIQEAYKAAHEQIVTTPLDVVAEPENVAETASEPVVEVTETPADLTDEGILAMMAEIEESGQPVTVEALAAKVDESTDSE
jgi:hypothetical protein